MTVNAIDPVFLSVINWLVASRADAQREYLDRVENLDKAIHALQEIGGGSVSIKIKPIDVGLQSSLDRLTQEAPQASVVKAATVKVVDHGPGAEAVPAKPAVEPPARKPDPAPIDKPIAIEQKERRSASAWVHEVAMGMPGNFGGMGVHRYICDHGPRLQLSYVQMLLRKMASEGKLRVVQPGRPGRESVFCVATRPIEMPKEIPGATPQYGRNHQNQED